ncbi:MAG: DUF2470 domain-containing protein [Proteobacteria bacterium]|nr:DUF2470 domain-containing protein [Pseudomonadota bacterium]MDA1058753.1 DUF2470 domain-containing protein [Pseudomonadota bacterium]
MTMPSEPVAIARRIIRGALTGALATIAQDTDSGMPYASLVLVATRSDGRPVLLLSALAEHTKNLLADSRASLMVDAIDGLASPLTGPRVTLQGDLVKAANDLARARYLARHPDAEAYVGFADFSFFQFEPKRVHLVAGFGAIHWLDWADVATPVALAADLMRDEASILDHVNADHGAAVAGIAAAAGGRSGEWRMTGCDPDGCDLRLGGESLRVDFAEPVHAGSDVRKQLVRLADTARKS